MARTTLPTMPRAWWNRQPWATVDPRKVRWANTPINRKAVEYYKRHPNGKFSPWDHDGPVCVVRAPDGTLEGRNGKHRALAAIEMHRSLRARLHRESR